MCVPRASLARTITVRDACVAVAPDSNNIVVWGVSCFDVPVLARHPSTEEPQDSSFGPPQTRCSLEGVG